MTKMVNDYFENMAAKEDKSNETQGMVKAYHAWDWSRRHDSDVMETGDNLPWEKDVPDFVKALRESGAKSIAVTEESTALMRTLHLMEKEGCKVEGLCKVSRKAGPFDNEAVDGRVEVRGIVVRL